MKRLFAYTFQTELPLAQITARLGEAGGWRWIERDSDRWGDYLSTIGVPGAVVKLFVNEPTPGTCAVNVRFESDDADAEARCAEVERTLVGAVLPAIGARAVTPAEYLE